MKKTTTTVNIPIPNSVGIYEKQFKPPLYWNPYY